jgi:Development and cell death domain
MTDFERCFIMLANIQTEQECIDRNLFGDKARRLECLDEIKPGDIGFLLNIDRDELVGVFRARSEAQLNIEPEAWKGKFAAQVRVELIGQLTRVEDAAYILGKAGVGMGQLASGIPAPQYPVHGQEVGEKLLVHFRESA